ncbi:AAA family ATPase [Anditalea andensis]|uniref:DUF3696 domain-containing protein n=1 Tax=Anditalea andensis TaxID=1048983 RepID=A0A074KZ96_9BACT|nr:DUF3696 domain-containing protein [Anditalea andensis]KEO72948.1 hypothetical protein EL17_15110 [Anditalea andensis]
MITSLELTGFKSFVDEFIEFKKLTILTGLNSSGKSSIIQSLLMLEKAAKNEKVYLPGHGSLSELKNNYSSVLGITAKIDNKETISFIDGETLVSSEISFPEIIHISADRFGPETSMPIYVDSFNIGRRGENIFQCIDHYGDHELPSLLLHEDSEGDTFLFNLRAWLGVISPNVSFVSKLEEIADSSFATFNGYRAKNVGFGLSYTLPIIVALFIGSIIKNSIVIIENPEAHLHPRGQVEIARLISLAVRTEANVIIETHSDHIFDGIRIQAKNLNSEFYKDVILYWFELDKNNNTITEESTLDKNGRLDNWPAGLFDQFGINASKLL